MADLDEIMSGSGGDSVVEQTPSVEQSTEGQPRDQQGRFAPQEQATEQAAPPAQVEQQEQRPPDGFVPIQALDARLAKQQERFEAQLRERDAIYQRQMEALRQPPKPAEPAKQPDYFEQPDAAVDFRVQQAIQPVQQGQQQIVENFSRMMAIDKFGDETVKAAYAEMANRMATSPQVVQFDYQRIMASPHPYGELVKWHKAQTALAKYGDDPEAAFNAEVERRLAARGGQEQPQTSQAPPVLPTSFANTRNAGPASAPAYSGPRPLSEIMNGR